MKVFILVFCCALVLGSCDQDRVYEYDQEFGDRAWKAADTARFEFGINDASRKYNVYLNVRNSLEYPFARLFVQYTLQDSSGKEIQKKLISDFLFDQKTGKPFGSSGLGDAFDHRVPILTNLIFKHTGKYKIKLEQFMRADTLKGVLAVGIRVETAQRK